MNDFDNLAIETLRVTSATMITKAKSGHTGICLDIAPTLHVLFTRFLNLYSASSKWINRDRFILSAGHGSALLYTLLHLSGFNISVDDLIEAGYLIGNDDGLLTDPTDSSKNLNDTKVKLEYNAEENNVTATVVD